MNPNALVPAVATVHRESGRVAYRLVEYGAPNRLVEEGDDSGEQMISPEVGIAGVALVLAVATGLIAHECAHALVLRLAGIEYTVAYAPGADRVVDLLASCPWAVVRPEPTGREPPWTLRTAAMAPIALAVPVFVGLAGGVLSVESPVVAALAVGWLACAIPSPQDFSVAFYAHRLLDADATAHGIGR